MTRSKSELCSLCKQTIIAFFSDIRENIFIQPKESKELFTVEIFFNQLHPERVMDEVVRHVLPFKEEIENKDEEFFTSSKGLYKGIEGDTLDRYLETIKSGKRVTQEDKDTAFEYFKTIVALAEEYKKNL